MFGKERFVTNIGSVLIRMEDFWRGYLDQDRSRNEIIFNMQNDDSLMARMNNLYPEDTGELISAEVEDNYQFVADPDTRKPIFFVMRSNFYPIGTDEGSAPRSVTYFISYKRELSMLDFVSECNYNHPGLGSYDCILYAGICKEGYDIPLPKESKEHPGQYILLDRYRWIKNRRMDIQPISRANPELTKGYTLPKLDSFERKQYEGSWLFL